MIVKSRNFLLKSEEIIKDDLPIKNYSDSEKLVLDIIKRWHTNKNEFYHHTSGSTGTPRSIQMMRDKIVMSTHATMESIDPNGLIKNSLLCLNPHHIGGAMVIYRGLIYDHDITLVEPSSHPFASVDNDEKFDIVSMMPMQFEHLNKNQIKRCGIILLGGAPAPLDSTVYPSKIYSTFGMTETISHIALRRIDEEEFRTTGDTIVASYHNNLLKIKGSLTNNKWLKTNDLVEIISSNTFKWIGREDFIINSGGIKINPEVIEDKLTGQFKGDMMIGSIPDKTLGRKVVLMSSGHKQKIDFSRLDKYNKPKACYFNFEIFKTTNGKIDRKKTQLHLEYLLNTQDVDDME